MTIEHKSLSLDIKDDSEDGSFTAYFASFGTLDRQGDVIEPNAFRNVDDFLKSGWIGLNHDMSALPVAYPIMASQDSKGLLIVGKYHSTPAAQSVRAVNRERLEAGKSVMGSIGYRVLDSEKSEKDGKKYRSLKSIDLFEASFVNLPANPQAQAVRSKGLTLDGLGDYLELLIEEEKAGRTVSEANHAKLVAMHQKLGEAHQMLGGFITEHDPRKPLQIFTPTSGKSAESLYLETLALRAKYLPLTL